MIRALTLSLFLVLQAGASEALNLTKLVEAAKPEVLALYQHLHAHPELSFMEEKTSARLAQEMRALGLKCTKRWEAGALSPFSKMALAAPSWCARTWTPCRCGN